MSTILGIARFRFHEGGAEEFVRLSEECRRIVEERDTGTIRYDIFFSEDESEAIVIEEYRDERALIEHGEHIGTELMSAVSATGDVRGEILGELSEEFRRSLEGGPVRAFAPLRS